jgi:hypothetical protein
VDSTRCGSAVLVISLLAQLLIWFHSLFTGLTDDRMCIVTRFLPSGEGVGIAAHSGRESETTITQSFLTTMGQRAARTYNENGH